MRGQRLGGHVIHVQQSERTELRLKQRLGIAESVIVRIGGGISSDAGSGDKASPHLGLDRQLLGVRQSGHSIGTVLVERPTRHRVVVEGEDGERIELED